MKKRVAVLIVTAGLVALLGLGAAAIRSSESGRPSVEVRAAGGASTSTSSSTSSSSSTTIATAATTTTTRRPTKSTSTTTAAIPATTTTVPMACADVTPQYGFALLRRPDGNGWAGGYGPALQRTTDGGRTWTSTCIQAAAVTGPGSFYGVTFAADGIRGWATGGTSQRPLAVRTVDGGDHWLASTVPADLTGSLANVVFVDAIHGWTVGSRAGTGPANAAGGYALATTDGGATWTARPVPSSVARLNRIVFADITHGWAVGAAADGRPAVIATNDGGTTWSSQTLPPLVAELRDIGFFDARRGWAVGESTADGTESPGVVLTTTDGGTTWTQQATTTRDLWSLAVVDADTLYAGGNYGLWASRNGGATWTEQAFTLPALDSISFADADHGWVTHSMFSAVCRTDDGGRTWTASNLRPGRTAPACAP
jgi:photosystem II stability/assembly factor-like uncharacterized protein